MSAHLDRHPPGAGAPPAGDAAAPAAPAAPAAASSAWSARRERGHPALMRLMAWIAVRLGRRVARVVLHPIAAYFLLSAPAALRRATAEYLERALGRPPTLRDHYRQLHSFASTVLDRVYLVRGCMHEFDLQVQGEHHVHEALAEGRGVVLVGAHLGSFEVLHALADTRPTLRLAMVMYPHNARMIHSVLHAVAPDFELGIIEIGQPGSTLAIRDWLDAGGLVGMLGDRLPPPGAARGQTVRLPLLGAPAAFSDGPLRVAQLLRRRVLFMVGLYLGGRRYAMRWVPLADFRDPPRDPAAREAQLHTALQAYVAQLDALCSEAPYNWFNFYDFWGDDAGAAH